MVLSLCHKPHLSGLKIATAGRYAKSIAQSEAQGVEYELEAMAQTHTNMGHALLARPFPPGAAIPGASRMPKIAQCVLKVAAM